MLIYTSVLAACVCTFVSSHECVVRALISVQKRGRAQTGVRERATLH